MPRKRRFFLPDVPVHVVQRGNNRQTVFFDDEDCQRYLSWLHEAATENGCVLHAFVLMSNHVHLLMTPAEGESVSAALQALGRRFVPYVNRRQGRSGTLWEGRFKAHLVQDEGYLLTCYRYIELNPVRAGMAQWPEDYAWSSYRANALSEYNPMLTPHPVYLALGADEEARRSAYRDLFGTQLDANTLRAVRSCLQTGTPLGNEHFRARVERALGLKVGYSGRGRPRKPAAQPGGDGGRSASRSEKGI